MVDACLKLAHNVPAIPAVADYGLLNYPPIRKIKRSRNPEPALHPQLSGIACCKLPFYSVCVSV